VEKLKSLTGMFQTPSDIIEFFDNWYDHPESKRLSFIRTIRSIGALSLEQHKETSFCCPVYSFPLMKPCNVGSCRFHVETKTVSHKNCVVHSLGKAKGGRLLPNEVATVLGLPIKEVNHLSISAINKIRKAVIKESLEKYQIPRYRHLDGHCVSCGVSIADELDLRNTDDLVIEFGRYGWCSEKCKIKKPAWQWQIEHEFECSFRVVLSAGLLLYNSYSELEDIFGVEQNVFKVYAETTELALLT